MDKITVVSCEKVKNGYKITLEDSPLYQDGKGGQLGDRGSIANKNILSVEKNYILVDGEVQLGENDLFIDYDRRKDIEVQHTAQHLFSAIAYNEYSLNTVGFRMAEEYSTVDLDSKDLTEENIKGIEKMVNNAIKSSIPVETSIVKREEVMTLEGMRKTVSEKVTGDVRIVKIGDLDTNACGGFHVNNICELQIFKILSWEKIKGNYTRFYYIAGNRAIEDYYGKNKLIGKLCQTLSCRENEIITMIDKMVSDKKSSELELRSITQNYAKILAKDLMNNSENINGKKLIFYPENSLVSNFLPKYIDISKYILIFGDSGQFTITSENINCKDFFSFLKTTGQIKGGGNESRVNLKGDISRDLIFQQLKVYLSKL
ncbi:alanyl-tRNA editing protein [Ilyobacter polytropus]|uniref:Threonyl/alanyl tRNA synthetase SAD n=1 Tax=Ilyobacter polytropus (strain ATCC 51220 / DSM 2926 / LMG 16218 / CuHBu1) TaxID=572544 RepID=E3H799_ILYPC|nr:alanyl-tRNA editing protein [Ilyobacter polytropus]ADO82580.1 Threonyl/alanyl tRNA synthetase SAD [Ilyobacter polytropus DSM 2926]